MTRLEFSAKVKDQAAQRAGGKCQLCGLPFAGKAMAFDHILPDALGGKPTLANCQVLCVPCHTAKTAKEDVPRIRKADRQRRAHSGIKASKSPPIKSAGFAKAEKPRKIDRSALPELPPRSLYRDV